MKIIDHNTIMALNLNYFDIYKYVDQSIYHKNSALLPAKISLQIADGAFFNVMPAILGKYGVGGLKAVSRYPNRIPTLDSQILLYDLNSGNLKALIDSSFITAIRTAAVAVHSIYNLAVKNFKSIAFMGLGIQAKATMRLVSEVFPDQAMTIKLLKYKEQHEDFAKYIASLKNAHLYTIVYCNNYDETIQNSDVIVSAVTYFESDISDESNFKKGCLLVPIHTRGFLNCDLAFDKIFVDDVKHVEKFANFNLFKHKMNEVTDVLNLKCKGRETNDERIIAYNIGIAIHDILLAERIYEIALKQGQYINVEFEAPKENNWFH